MTQERVTGAASAGSRPSRRKGRLDAEARPAEEQNGKRNGNGGDAAVRALEAPHRRREATLPAKIANFVLLTFWRSMSLLLRHVPAGPAYRVGGWFAMAGYALSPLRRRWLRANFGHVLGVSPSDPAAGRLARAAYRNYARYVMELMRLPGMSVEQAESMLVLDGLDRFMEIWRQSQGLVVVSAHLGNNEAMAAGFTKFGLPVSVVGDDTAYNGVYDLLNKQRAAWGVEVISWRNLRAVYGVLKRKACLGLLVDWGYRADGIPVKLFDAWTTLPAGPAILAARHGADILPFLIQRLPDGRFRASAADPIHVPSNSPADIALATQRIATALEGFIGPAPEQWYIFKPIWPATAAESAELEARHADMLAGIDRKRATMTMAGESYAAGEAGPSEATSAP